MAHQTKYLHVRNKIYYNCLVFIWSSLLYKSKRKLVQTKVDFKFFNLSASKRFTKRLWHRWFPVNFVKFLRTPFFIEHSKNLHCVCYRWNLLRWMFFVPCDNWKTFNVKLCVNRHIIVFFETNVLKEVRILRCLHNNIAITFVADFFYDNVFYNLYCLTVPHFSL